MVDLMIKRFVGTKNMIDVKNDRLVITSV